MNYLLDTNIVSFAIRKNLQITERIEDIKAQRKSISIFLDDLAILEKAAEIHANLRFKGLPIQTKDVLIGATAMELTQRLFVVLMIL
jgi:tRNA(fMet)-specific endonuclease VapC